MKQTDGSKYAAEHFHLYNYVLFLLGIVIHPVNGISLNSWYISSQLNNKAWRDYSLTDY